MSWKAEAFYTFGSLISNYAMLQLQGGGAVT